MLIRVCVLALCAGCLSLAGCSLPVAKTPLTDAKTSTLDKRLLGEWEVVTSDGERTPLLLERSSESENVMLASNPREADAGRLPLYATRIGEISCISVQIEPESDKPYLIAKYEFNAAEDTVSFFVLHSHRLAHAIEDGELKGRVERNPPPADPNRMANGPQYREIVLTDDPKEISAFIAKHSADCFVMDQPFVKLERKTDR